MPQPARTHHKARNRLFLPTPRQTVWLVSAGFLALGYALYLRYLAIENSTVGLACQAGLETWLCMTRAVVILSFTYSAFGIAALVLSLLNLIRPSLSLFALGLVASAFGIVLYNAGLSGLAFGLLLLSFARPYPGRETE